MVRHMKDAHSSAATTELFGITCELSRKIVTLLIAARRGDRVALGQLFDVARHRLLDAASRGLPLALRGRVGPSDVVQETAIDVQRDFAHFKGTTAEELFAWLRSILNHNLIDAVRHHGLTEKRSPRRELRLGDSRVGRGALTLVGVTRPPDSSAIRKEDAADLHATLARLPEDYRTVIWLRYWRGMSFDEVAVQMGRSTAATRKLWHRAMQRLGSELKAQAAAELADERRDAATQRHTEDSGESCASPVA